MSPRPLPATGLFLGGVAALALVEPLLGAADPTWQLWFALWQGGPLPRVLWWVALGSFAIEPLVAVQQLGHLTGGFFAELAVEELRIGALRWVRRDGRMKLELFHQYTALTTGWTRCAVPDPPARARRAVVLLGGPVSSGLALALVFFSWQGFNPGRPVEQLLLAKAYPVWVAAAAGVFLWSAIPHAVGGVPSPGLQLLRLFSRATADGAGSELTRR